VFVCLCALTAAPADACWWSYGCGPYWGAYAWGPYGWGAYAWGPYSWAAYPSAAAYPQGIPSASQTTLGVYVDEPLSPSPLGLRVAAVASGSPAAEAGIQVGDRILGINKHETLTPAALIAALQRHEPGDSVTVRVANREAERKVAATLGQGWPPHAQVARRTTTEPARTVVVKVDREDGGAQPTAEILRHLKAIDQRLKKLEERVADGEKEKEKEKKKDKKKDD
jgi:C-terminal processing protease CtpA/Prc